MNRGDTINYEIQLVNEDEEPISLDGYQEIEFQINCDTTYCSVKKLLSKGEIVVSGNTMNIHLTQDDTFKLLNGENKVKIRLKKNEQTTSSDEAVIEIGDSISSKRL